MTKGNGKRPALASAPSLHKNAGIAPGATPSGSKRPVIAQEPESYMHRKMAWRIGRIQLADPFGWHELDLSGILAIQNKLASFEGMTFGEVFLEGNKRNHEIPVDSIPNKIARQWIIKNLPGQTSLWTLRLTGAQRIWGILGDGAYQIVFWDPQHHIYPTSK